MAIPVPGTNPPVESVCAGELRVNDIIFIDGCRCKVIATDHGRNNKGTPVGRAQIISAPKNSKDRKLSDKMENMTIGGDDSRQFFREI